MQYSIRAMAAFAALSFATCVNAADEAEFDVDTQILYVPKVKIADGYVYEGKLQLEPSGLFSLQSYSSTPSSSEFTLTSPAVVDNLLLSAYQCESKTDGVEASIPLAWSNAPAGTASFAVTMVHYPNAEDTTNLNSYLLLWGIDASVTEIAHGAGDDGPWFMGANKDVQGVSYTSPCSPSAGSHSYTLTIYALSETPSSLPAYNTVDVTYDVLMAAINSVTVLGTASLTFDSVTQ